MLLHIHHGIFVKCTHCSVNLIHCLLYSKVYALNWISQVVDNHIKKVFVIFSLVSSFIFVNILLGFPFKWIWQFYVCVPFNIVGLSITGSEIGIYLRFFRWTFCQLGSTWVLIVRWNDFNQVWSLNRYYRKASKIWVAPKKRNSKTKFLAKEVHHGHGYVLFA